MCFLCDLTGKYLNISSLMGGGLMAVISKKTVTEYILKVAKYIPFVFPKWIVSLSNDYHEKNGEVSWGEREEKIKSISYFSGDFKWKAVTLSSVISRRDVRVIEEQLSKIKLNTTPEIFNKLSKTSIESHGCFSYTLGVFNINKDHHFDELGTLYLKGEIFSGVYISLFKSPSGFFVLTYYFFMNDVATNLVKNLDVSNLNCYREFVGFNFYKRKNRVIRYIDRRVQALELIKKNTLSVLEEAKCVVGYIGEKLGVTPTEFLTGVEFYKNQDVPYFQEGSIPQNQDDAHIYYVNSSIHNALHYSDDPCEQFYNAFHFEKDVFDFSYLLCKKEESFDNFDNYLKQYYGCYEKHLVFIPLYMIHKKVSQLVEKISDVVSTEKSSDLAKHHDIVYDCLSQTESIKKWLSEIEADYNYSAYGNYHKAISDIINRQRERINELLSSTKTFYALSENRVQVQNIKYSKRNSKFVFWLVMIQIVLAAMTIDFLKKGQWYSPLIEHIISLFK